MGWLSTARVGWWRKVDVLSLRGYLSKIRVYIVFSTFMFVLSVVAGFLYAHYVPERSTEYFSTLKQVMAHKFGGLGSSFMLFAIFFNNLMVTLIMLVFGLFFGFMPGIGIVVNGLLLGVVTYFIGKESVFILFSIIPHGIFEIPVFLISAAIGLRLGHLMVRKLFGDSSVNLSEELREGIYFYLKWGVPILFLAAFLEVYVSLRIAHIFR